MVSKDRVEFGYHDNIELLCKESSVDVQRPSFFEPRAMEEEIQSMGKRLYEESSSHILF